MSAVFATPVCACADTDDRCRAIRALLRVAANDAAAGRPIDAIDGTSTAHRLAGGDEVLLAEVADDHRAAIHAIALGPRVAESDPERYREHRESRLLSAALALAQSLPDACLLLEGGSVPATRLDARYAATLCLSGAVVLTYVLAVEVEGARLALNVEDQAASR